MFRLVSISPSSRTGARAVARDAATRPCNQLCKIAPIAGRICAGKCFFLQIAPAQPTSCRRNQRTCVRNAGDALVRTGNSGENEANFFSSPNSPKTNFLKNESADKNVSRGQMRDQIVAIRDAFL
jgi:hypothetical protein